MLKFFGIIFVGYVIPLLLIYKRWGDIKSHDFLKKKEKDEILIHPIYTVSNDIKVKGVVNPVKWIKSFYSFNYSIV